MNAKHEPSAEKKPLVDTLLAIDSRMPTKSAEGREVAQKVLRRDRRRVRILTWMTSGLFLLMVIGICGCLYWYDMKVLPVMIHFDRDFNEWAKSTTPEPDLSKQSPQTNLAVSTAISCRVLYRIQLANLGGTMALFVVMLAAASSTVLLIRATRGATLRQIQASLLALSEQFDALQQSLQSGQSSGGGEAPRKPNGG
jgi:hypothetical protein